MSVPDVFDPYRKWLGIPPAEQPPHHYRLLGVGLFEDDADTIAGAADRQMAHVRTFQTGQRSELSQKLLNELAAARLTLLNSTKKAAYDEQLRTKLAATTGGGGEAGQGRGGLPVEAPAEMVQPPRPVPLAPVPLAAGQGRGAPPPVPAPIVSAGAAPAAAPFVASSTRHLHRTRSQLRPVWVGLLVAGLAFVAAGYGFRELAKREPPQTSVARQDQIANAAVAGGSKDVENEPITLPISPTELQDDGSAGANLEDESRDGTSGMAADAPPAKSPQHEDRGDGKSQEEAMRLRPAADEASAKPRSLADLASMASRPRLATTHRETPPEGKALKAAEARFFELYEQDIARAKKAEAVRKLTIRVTNQAEAGDQTADVRYVMLGQAGNTAMARGWVGLAYHIATEISRQFEVDSFALKLKTIEVAAKAAETPTANAIGVLQALALADRAVMEGAIEVASKASNQAALLARKTKDKSLIARTERHKLGLRGRSARHLAYKSALLELKKTPEDRASNLLAGKYEVLALGDWEEGLAKLARSGESRLVEVAGLEAAARVDLSQLAPLAVAWWQAAEAEQDAFFQGECRLQARYCYLRARRLGRAGGVPPQVAESLQSLSGYPLSRLRAGAAARYYQGADFQSQRIEREDPVIDLYFGEGSPDPSMPTNFFSARWTGFFKPPIAGRYRIVTFTNDSVRLWVDGQQVLNRWGQNAQWQQIELELSDEPHRLRLEFNETFEVGVARLGWSLAEFPDDQHQQWSPIDALYYDPDSPFESPESP